MAEYRLKWDPTTGPLPAVHLANAKSAFAKPAFESAVIAEGVGLGTMAPCARDQLPCIMRSGLAFISAGEMRCIWAGRHVTSHMTRLVTT